MASQLVYKSDGSETMAHIDKSSQMFELNNQIIDTNMKKSIDDLNVHQQLLGKIESDYKMM